MTIGVLRPEGCLSMMAAKAREPPSQSSALSHREEDIAEDVRTNSKSRPSEERTLSRNSAVANRGCMGALSSSGAFSSSRTASRSQKELLPKEPLREPVQPMLQGPVYQPEALLALLKRGSTGVLIAFRDLHMHGASTRLYIAPINGHPPVLSASKSTFSAASMAARKLSESEQMQEKARAMSFLFKGTVQWV